MSLPVHAYNENGPAIMSSTNFRDSSQFIGDDQSGPWKWDLGMGTSFFSQPFINQASLLPNDAFTPHSPTGPSPQFHHMDPGSFQVTPSPAVTSTGSTNLMSSRNGLTTQTSSISPSHSGSVGSPEPVLPLDTRRLSPKSNALLAQSEDALPPFHH